MTVRSGALTALVFLMALIVGVAASRIGRGDGSAEAKQASRSAGRSSDPVPVEVYRVSPQRLAETLIAPGTLVANDRIDVVSEIAGTVSEILFAEGRRVRQGDLLVKIDDRELVTERDRIAARLELAERRSARQGELHEQGLISDDELETTETEADALRAELARVEVRLDKTEIRAPFSGVVGLRRISEGAYLSPQTTITTLVDSDPIKLDFAVPERYSDRFSVGDVVTFEVDDPGSQVAGPQAADPARQASIYAIEPTVDAETRTVPMRARAPNRDGRLLPGGFADVTLAVDEVEDALAVPAIAVIAELGGKKVFVAHEGRAEPRQVEAGIRTGDQLQILRGLEPGDLVIVSGLQFLRPGIEVAVQNALGEPGP